MFLLTCGSDIGYMIDRLCPLVFACANNTGPLSQILFNHDADDNMEENKFDNYCVKNIKVKNFFGMFHVNCGQDCGIPRGIEQQCWKIKIIFKVNILQLETSASFLEFNEVQYVKLSGFLTKTCKCQRKTC